MRFVELEEPVRALLREFDPARRSYHPGFRSIISSTTGLWGIADQPGNDARPLGTAVGRLRAADATSRLVPDFEKALMADPVLFAAAVRALLEANFPPSVHDDVLARFGLEAEPGEVAIVPGRRRDPAFRSLVLVAYEYRWAMCGFDGLIGGDVIGLDAAHVRWWAIGGPDTVDNGLALCVLHHRLFDRGVLGLGIDGTVMVLQSFVGRAPASEAQMLSLVGMPLLGPQLAHPRVADEHRHWRTSEVFRGPPRSVAA